VGADNSSTSFYGVFSNGGTASLGLTKVGTGTLSCDGDSTSTGPVTVQGGTLALAQIFGSGSFSNASVISIASGATLDVSTRADGTLTLNSGQTLKHSGSSTGPITVTGSVNLGNGTLLLGVNRTGLAHDSLAASGSVTYSGTLAVTNTGAALQPGDKFQLFPSAVSGFTTYALPTVDAVNFVQYTWQNDVATDGSVTVLTVAPLTPPTLGVSQTGNTLNFSWTGPFKLQSQTNSLNVGISSNWFNYPGGSTSPVSVTINPTNPTVFFRLSLQ
jgi:autotransporter-associated beta strand protein